jgi:hypothetical protein
VRHFHKTGRSKNPPFLRLMRPQVLQASIKRERLHQFPLSFVSLGQFPASIRRALVRSTPFCVGHGWLDAHTLLW